MITTIKLQESRKEQILARLPGPCQASIEDRFSTACPECINCRRQVLSYACSQSGAPDEAARQLRDQMSHLDCPGGHHLRRQQQRQQSCHA